MTLEHTSSLALQPRIRQGTPTGLFGRERFRRFLLGDGVAAPRTTCLPLVPLALEFRWRFLVKGVGERDSGDFDGELVHSSMPRVKRLSLHGGGETDKKEGDMAGSFYVRHFSDLQNLMGITSWLLWLLGV